MCIRDRLPIFLTSVLGAPAFALGVIEGVADGVSTFFELWSGWYSDRIGKRKGLAACKWGQSSRINKFVDAVCLMRYQSGHGKTTTL